MYSTLHLDTYTATNDRCQSIVFLAIHYLKRGYNAALRGVVVSETLTCVCATCRERACRTMAWTQIPGAARQCSRTGRAGCWSASRRSGEWSATRMSRRAVPSFYEISSIDAMRRRQAPSVRGSGSIGVSHACRWRGWSAAGCRHGSGWSRLCCRYMATGGTSNTWGAHSWPPSFSCQVNLLFLCMFTQLRESFLLCSVTFLE